ncbi:MAG: DMT family transporter [Gammaproteobacteria bacterium]
MDWSSKNVIIGNILLILSAISWAVAMLCTRYLPWHSSSIEMAPWQLLLACIPMVILAVIFEPHAHIIWNLSLYGALAFTSLLATAFAFWALVYVTRELPVTTTALSMLGVPVVSVIASALLLGEAFTSNNIIAMALILGGLICAAIGDGKASKNGNSESSAEEGAKAIS